MTKQLHNSKHLEKVWYRVPADYYQKGVKNNIFQKIWHFNKLKHVSDALYSANTSPRSILDAGAASGWFLSEIKKNFPNSKCVGIDIYKDAVSYGKKNYKSLALSVADIHKLPFKSESFDVVICCEVLEHVVYPNQALREIKRVLKPEGVSIIEIDTGNLLFRIAWFFWTTLRRGVWRDSHLHLFNTKILEKLFKDCEFKIERKKIFNLTMAVVYTLRSKQY